MGIYIYIYPYLVVPPVVKCVTSLQFGMVSCGNVYIWSELSH